MGSRAVPFSATLYIERDDFAENPPAKWKRLAPGQAVRLRGSYVIVCDEVIKDAQGNIVELKCHHDPATLGKNPEGYKANGVIHWVSAAHATDAEIRLYDYLFTEKNPMAADNFLDTINPHSLTVIEHAKIEPAAYAHDARTSGTAYQFERQGYFALDPDSTAEKPVFNRTLGLKDGSGK